MDSIDVSNPKELLDYMTSNFSYNHSKHFRSVYEVISSKKVDCQDASEFENYYFEKMNIHHERLFMLEYHNDSEPW